jgi:hypothetical protein
MRKSLIMLALALPLCTAACAKSPKDRLQGKWLGESISNIDAEQGAEVSAWVKGTSLEFSGERMTVTIPAEQPRSGEFKVAKVDGSKLTVAVTREGGSDTALLVLADDGSLQWDVGDGRAITMARLK